MELKRATMKIITVNLEPRIDNREQKLRYIEALKMLSADFIKVLNLLAV
jgi:hypothetical protein